jgi:uncharacterized tellurite resistance protein B-like protein
VRASAAQRLDVQRGSILEIIETKKANSAAELERIRKELAKELEKSHSNLDAILKAVSEYRAAVGSLASGKIDRDLANECAGKLNLAMDFVSSNSALYHALESFRQRGIDLVDRADGLSSEEEYRSLWRALGVSFAADAENLKALLMAVDERVLRGH